MRQIKFRGKRADNGEWAYGELDYGVFSGNSFVDGIIIPETVGQYTGLKDKNGVEIYEGDVIKTDDNHKFKVIWDETRFIGVDSVRDGSGYICYIDSHYKDGKSRLEIIGNIYDNPELMELRAETGLGGTMKIKKNTRYLIETKEDLQDFLERCEKQGWKWRNQKSPLDYTPDEIPCVIICDTNSQVLRSGLAWLTRTDSYDKIYKRKTPPTLAEFLGWEEGVKYDNGESALFMIIDGVLHYKLKTHSKSWNPYAMSLRDDNLSNLRKFKKAQPKLYYAKIKGWELKRDCEYYWSVPLGGSELENRIKGHASKFTKCKWNDLGINDTNADFEEVE